MIQMSKVSLKLYRGKGAGGCDTVYTSTATNAHLLV